MVGDDKFDGEWSYESPGCFSVIDEESCGVWDFKIALNVAIETRPSMSHMAGVLVQVMKLDCTGVQTMENGKTKVMLGKNKNFLKKLCQY